MNKVTIQLKKTPERVELIKAMASTNDAEATQARNAFAAAVGPIVQQALDLMAMSRLIFTDWPYNKDDNPVFPLDKFWDAPVDSVTVWYQTAPGGLGTTQVVGRQEITLTTYTIDGAVSFNEKALRRGSLPYVALGLNRLTQEVLVKSERNKWFVVLKALAEAQTNGSQHLIESTATDVLQIADFNNLLVLGKRINRAFNGGTPDIAEARGVTDLFLSPEAMADVRAMAYQPQNTRPGSLTTSGATAIPLPDDVRQQIYEAAGEVEIFGIALHEMQELGRNERYNTIFDTLYSGPLTFSTSNQEIVIGVDRTREAIIRPIAEQDENGGRFVVQTDDQFPKRSGKIGFFGKLEEGALVVDARAIVGLIIK